MLHHLTNKLQSASSVPLMVGVDEDDCVDFANNGEI